METKPTPSGPVDRPVGRLCGIVAAAWRAEKLMRQAGALSELALDAGLDGREREANVMSLEAAKRRQEAADLLAPYKPPNTR